MDHGKRLICDGGLLQEGKHGVRFLASSLDGQPPCPAFVIRFSGVVHAYFNRCSHVPVQLDWEEGEFFDLSGLYLVCSTHGATYLPESGRCVAGPCSGRGLVRLPVEEIDGQVYLITEDSKETIHG